MANNMPDQIKAVKLIYQITGWIGTVVYSLFTIILFEFSIASLYVSAEYFF
jgi:hypothetical protein